MTVTIAIEVDSVAGPDRLAIIRALIEDLGRQGVPSELAEQLISDHAKPGVGAPEAVLLIHAALSAGMITAVVRVVTAYLRRQGMRKVVVERDGLRVEVTGTSARELRRLEGLLGAGEPPTEAEE